jgi:hypothetical protein
MFFFWMNKLKYDCWGYGLFLLKKQGGLVIYKFTGFSLRTKTKTKVGVIKALVRDTYSGMGWI